MKIAIVQSGPSNAGKTSAIRECYEMLRKAYPDAIISHEAGRGKDFRVVLTIGKTRIGIESLGDPSNHRQDESLLLFVELRCVAIICASRTRGATYDRVRMLSDDGYEVIWRHRPRDLHSISTQENRREAKWMFTKVKTLI
jgi:hypothetical protein